MPFDKSFHELIGSQPAAQAQGYQNNPLDDPRFKTDLRNYFAKKGEWIEDDQELLEKFYADRTWGNLNMTFGMGGDYLDASQATPEDRELHKRIQSAYEQMPMFWEEGGAGERLGYSTVAKEVGKALILDPLNLIPLSKVGTVAKMAKLGGASAKQAIKQGATHGAIWEGAGNAAIAAGADAGLQHRDKELGLQDEMDLGRVGMSAAFGGAIGTGLGALIGTFAAKHGVTIADNVANELITMGYTPEMISSMPPADMKRLFRGEYLNRSFARDYYNETPEAIEKAHAEGLGIEAANERAQPNSDTILPYDELQANFQAKKSEPTNISSLESELASLEAELSGIEPSDPKYAEVQKDINDIKNTYTHLLQEQAIEDDINKLRAEGRYDEASKRTAELDTARRQRAIIEAKQNEADAEHLASLRAQQGERAKSEQHYQDQEIDSMTGEARGYFDPAEGNPPAPEQTIRTLLGLDDNADVGASLIEAYQQGGPDAVFAKIDADSGKVEPRTPEEQRQWVNELAQFIGSEQEGQSTKLAIKKWNDKYGKVFGTSGRTEQLATEVEEYLVPFGRFEGDHFIINDGSEPNAAMADALDQAITSHKAKVAEKLATNKAKAAEAPKADAPKPRKTPVTSFRSELESIPEVAGLAKFDARSIQRVAKNTFGIQGAKDMSTEELVSTMVKANIDRAAAREAEQLDGHRLFQEALEDYAEEVHIDGKFDRETFERFLATRPTYARQADEIMGIYDDAAGYDDAGELVSKMDDSSVDPVDPIEDNGNLDGDTEAGFDLEDEVSRMRKGDDFDELVPFDEDPASDDLIAVIRQAKEEGVTLTERELLAIKKKAERLAQQGTEHSEWFKNSPIANNIQATRQTMTYAHMIDMINERLKNKVVGRPDRGGKNVRSNADILEEQSKFVTDAMDKSRDNYSRAKNPERTNTLAQAKAALDMGTDAMPQFHAPADYRYLDADGYMQKAKKGKKLLLVKDTHGKQMAVENKKAYQGLMKGFGKQAVRDNLKANKPAKADPKQQAGLTNEAVPSGRRLSIAMQNADGTYTIRVVGDAQIKRGVDAKGLQGKSKDTWMVGHVNDNYRAPRGNIINAAEFKKEFATDLEQAVTITTREEDLTRRVPAFNDVKGEMVEADMGAILSPDSFESNDLNMGLLELHTFLNKRNMLDDGNITIEGLHVSAAWLEGKAMPWMRSNGTISAKDMGALTRKLKEIYTLQAYATPNGISLPNGAKVTQLGKLRSIFADYDHKTTQFTYDLMNRLALTQRDGKAPVINDGKGFAHNFDPTSENFNAITLDANPKNNSRPKVYALLHESGHWAYQNVLNPAEKKQFVTALEQAVKDGSIRKMMPSWEGNYGTVNEAFAEMFASWASRERYSDTVLNDTFWQGVTKKIKAIYERLVFGKNNDELISSPEFEELFERILPDDHRALTEMVGISADRIFPDSKAYIDFFQSHAMKTAAGKESNYGRGVRLAKKLDMITRLQAKLADPDFAGWENIADSAEILESSQNIYGTKELTKREKQTVNRITKIQKELRQYFDHGDAVWDDMIHTKKAFAEWEAKGGTGDMDSFTVEVLLNPQHTSSIPYALNIAASNFRNKIMLDTGAWIGDGVPRAESVVKRAINEGKRHSKKSKMRAQPTTNTVPPAVQDIVDPEPPKPAPAPTPEPVKAKAKEVAKKTQAKSAVQSRKKGKAESKAKQTVQSTSKGKATTAKPTNNKGQALPQLRKQMVSKDDAVARKAAFEYTRSLAQTKTLVGQKKPEIDEHWLTATRFELRDGLIDAIKRGDMETADQIDWVFKQRGAAKQAGLKAGLTRGMLTDEAQEVAQLKPKFRTGKASKALKSEMDDSVGFADDGVMPNARANIRAFQLDMTHRDPEVGYDMRQMFYRLIALTDQQNESLPLSTINRIVGKEAGSPSAVATTASDGYITLRTKLRRISSAMQKAGSYDDAMNDLAHMVARASMSDTDMQVLSKVMGDDALDKFTDHWQGIATGQRSVTDALSDVDAYTASQYGELMESLGEGMALTLRGVVKRDDIHQAYRWLSAYGDPFAQHTPNLTAHSAHARDGVSPAFANSFATDYLESLPDAKVEQMHAWTGDFIQPFYVKGSAINATDEGLLGRGIYLSDTPNHVADTAADVLDSITDDTTRQLADNYLAHWDRVQNKISAQRKSIEAYSGGDDAELAELHDGLNQLLANENLWREKLEALDIEAPMVQPVLINLQTSANLTDGMLYAPDNFLVKRIMQNVGAKFDAAKVRSLQNKIGSGVDGEQLYGHLTEWFTQFHGSPERARTDVRELLEGLGYDSALIGRDEATRIVAFNPDNVRALTDEFDIPTGSTMDIDATPMRDFFRRTILNGEDLGDGDIAELVSRMEDTGLDKRAGDSLMKSPKGKALTEQEHEALKKHSITNVLRENSGYLRRNKMGWVADKFKPEEGTGYFERFSTEMGAKLMPIHELMKSLPGFDSRIKRHLNAMTPSRTKQPASMQRIVRAIRMGDDTVLKSQAEKDAAKLIRSTFEQEWQRLQQAGLATSSGRQNYFPQIWSVEKLEAKPNEFRAKLAQFITDKNFSETGLAMEAGEANRIAENIANTIISTDSDFASPSKLKGTASEHVDAHRHLDFDGHQGHLRIMQEFMEDDLEAILVKYMQGTTRRRMFYEMFGHNNHGFYDFTHTLVTGRKGAVELLTSGMVKKTDMTAITSHPEAQGKVTDQLQLFKPLFKSEAEAYHNVDRAIELIKTQGKDAAKEHLKAFRFAGTDNAQANMRIDAVVEALAQFDGQVNKVPTAVLKNAEAIFDSYQGKSPFRKSAGYEALNAGSKFLRTINAVTLLSYSTLTSFSDVALPLVRSGSFTTWAKGMARWATNPHYRSMLRNVGVAMESIMHDRMANMYGQEPSLWMNAFFNASMLTPWTNKMREMSAAVAVESFKAEQRIALSSAPGTAAHKKAVKYLRHFGLAEYIKKGDLSSEEAIMKDPKVREAIMRFTNETVFSPNANDVPILAQSPVGALIYQLKSFPTMMMRLGGTSLKEAKDGRVMPLILMGTALPAVGAASLGTKDFVQSRGGHDEKSAELREREGLAEWYRDATLQAGGLGIIAETLYALTEQADNGAYGRERMTSVVLGPTYGLFTDAAKVGAAVQDTLTGDDSKNSKEREGARALMGRVPFAGGNKFLRESVVDWSAGKAKDQKSKSKFGGGFDGGFGGGFSGGF